jgi:nucleoside phosphorylase
VIDTIFVPRGAEAGAVRTAAARARSDVRVVELGIGPIAARYAANEAIEAIEANGSIGRSLVTGLCGLLSPAFSVGDALVYREMYRDGEPTFELERELGDAVAAKLPSAQTGIRAFASDVVVETPAAKLELARRTSTEAVDMESYAVAERLRREGIPVAVLRVGSDGVGDELPELDRALDHAGGLDGFALALAMLRKPAAGARMALNGTRALGALRRAIETVLR